jgi:hypothetical protein
MLLLMLRIHIRLVTLVIPLLDRMLPTPRLVRLLAKHDLWHPYRDIPADTIAKHVHTALRKPHWMKRRACYRLGLTMSHFLHLAGKPVVLHFAIAPPSCDAMRLHGHCWVTLDDRAITAPPEPSTGMRTFVRFNMGSGSPLTTNPKQP